MTEGEPFAEEATCPPPEDDCPEELPVRCAGSAARLVVNAQGKIMLEAEPGTPVWLAAAMVRVAASALG